MNSEEAIPNLGGYSFPGHMNAVEQEEWLITASTEVLDKAAKYALRQGRDSDVERISKERERRVEADRHTRLLAAAQASATLLPEPKKPLYLTWDFWKWVIASLFLPVILWFLKLSLGF
jgi:hypothetical protein